MWVRTKAKKGAFANLTVNGLTKVVKEVGERVGEWLMATGNGLHLGSAVVQLSRGRYLQCMCLSTAGIDVAS